MQFSRHGSTDVTNVSRDKIPLLWITVRETVLTTLALHRYYHNESSFRLKVVRVSFTFHRFITCALGGGGGRGAGNKVSGF